MSTHTRRDDRHTHSDNLNEGYWDALLSEGEFSQSVEPENIAEAVDTHNSIHPIIQDTETTFSSLEEDADWKTIERIMDNDETLDLKVIGYNRGGLLIEWHSLRGFVPASQLVDFPQIEQDWERRDRLVEHVGLTISLRVIELDREKNRLILSERAAQVEAGTREHILEHLQPNDVIIGRVTNLCNFGAFVDLGGVEGLIHISELSWGRVGHPNDVLTSGETIEVFVLDVDPDEARVALSVKRLHPDPWATVETRYTVDEVVEGVITNVVDFGAFACIEEGLEGLIHFSELAEGHFLHPRNVVSEGDTVRARILSIDGKARRLGLSLRLL